MVFELFYVSFGQFIAALSPNELLASLLVPCFFTFIVAFCGVVVPYMALPTFWRSWMYWLTPFHYLLEGFLGVVVHGVPMECVEREESFFSLPPGLSTCQEYAGAFVDAATGYVRDAGGGMCAYCQFSDGDQFVWLPSSYLPYLTLPYSTIRETLIWLGRQRTLTSTTVTSGATTGFSGHSWGLISRRCFSSRGFICMASMMRRGGLVRGGQGV